MSCHRLTKSDTSINLPLLLKWVINAPVGGSFCMSRILFIFQDLFTSLTRHVSATALVYLKGVLLCHRRNYQVMAEELQESNRQRLHHFITGSRWCFQSVKDVVTLQFWQMLQHLGSAADCCLIIDDSGNPKKGLHSAGVKRQYCGQVGKTENSQVGVFGALCAGSLVNLVQARLSGIHKQINKIDQATEIIAHAIKELKIKVRWVCFDAFYGRDLTLLAELIKYEIEFVADVPDDMRMWLPPFQMRIPKRRKGSPGPQSKKARPNVEHISINQYAASLKTQEWKYLTVRHESGGRKLQGWCHSRNVYILNPQTNRRQLITLLIRKDKDGTIKYSFCHCPGASLKELAYRQSKRCVVEKSFREAKRR